jgi:hypothetical protein
MLNEERIILEYLNGKDSLECLGLNERIIIRLVLEKQGRK